EEGVRIGVVEIDHSPIFYFLASPRAVGWSGWYKPISCPLGSVKLVRRPQRSCATGAHGTPRVASCAISASTSSHIKYRIDPSIDLPCSPRPNASAVGCTAASAGGSAKISQPPPTSTDGNANVSRRKARSASALVL